MKKIIILIIGVIITASSFGQVAGNFKQIRLLNNTDSIGLGSTTGIIRYDPLTGKFRFYNALTSTWFSYNTGSSISAGDGLTLSSGTIRIGGSLTANRSFTGDFKISFGGGSTNASINLASIAGNPSAVAVGDMWRNSTTDAIMGRWTTAGSAAFVYAPATITNAIPVFSTSTLPGGVGVSSSFTFDGTILRTPALLLSTTPTLDNTNTNILTIDGSGNVERVTNVIRGSTGSTDNVIPIANGTGGLTIEASLWTISDFGSLTIGNSGVVTTGYSVSTSNSSSNASLVLAPQGTLEFSPGVLNTNNANTQILTLAGGVLEIRDASTLGSTLTSTQVAYGSALNNVTSEAAFNYNAALNLLTVPAISTTDLSTTNALVSSLTTGRVVFAGASDALVDEAALTYDASTNIFTIGAGAAGGSLYISDTGGGANFSIGNQSAQYLTMNPDFMTSIGGDFSIGGANGLAAHNDAYEYEIIGGDAYSVSGDGNGGPIIIRPGNKRGAGSGTDGELTLAVDASNGGYLIITGLPTSSAGLPSGAIWSNAGVLTIIP